MRSDLKADPRHFTVGQGIEIRDYGAITLEADEMVTLRTAEGKAHDVTAKSWGFYATASVNGRLANEGFKTALARSTRTGRYFVLLVDAAHMADFEAYMQQEAMQVIEWLDERE